MESQEASALERKRKRLEAWKRKKAAQQQAAAAAAVPNKKVSLSLKKVVQPSKSIVTKKKPKPITKLNAFGESDDDDDDDSSNRQSHQEGNAPSKQLKRKSVFDLEQEEKGKQDEESSSPPKRKKRKGRWDNAPSKEQAPVAKDALDEFMEKLQSGADGVVKVGAADDAMQIDVGGSMLKPSNQSGSIKAATPSSSAQVYQPSDWLSDAPTDDEQEEQARRALVEALKAQPAPVVTAAEGDVVATEEDTEVLKPAQLAAEVRSEKARREQRLLELERQAAEARASAESAAQPKLGRLYMDSEGGVMEEAERYLDAAKATPDALVVLAELNKKKELKAVDHSKIDYLPFQKNLYRVPRSLANLTNDDVISRRAKLKVRVRGHGAPAPVSTFEECGLSERVLQVLKSHDIDKPFPVQAQCIPCIMAGRDVIGIAKTGSGKTLAYLLPMLRHILVQPPLAPNESGPIGLVLAPARELAYQIYTVCKGFAKPLGLK